MKKELISILTILCVVTHIVRLVYEILKHKKVLVPGRLSFIIVFTNMLLLWSSWFIFCKYDYHEVRIHDTIRYIALSMSLAGLISFLTGLSTIKTLESYKGNLITTGIYSYIRHPMYLGFVLWLISLPLYFEALLPLLLSVMFIFNVLGWRFLEEKELEKRFPAYLEYKKKTLF